MWRVMSSSSQAMSWRSKAAESGAWISGGGDRRGEKRGERASAGAVRNHRERSLRFDRGQSARADATWTVFGRKCCIVLPAGRPGHGQRGLSSSDMSDPERWPPDYFASRDRFVELAQGLRCRHGLPGGRRGGPSRRIAVRGHRGAFARANRTPDRSRQRCARCRGFPRCRCPVRGSATAGTARSAGRHRHRRDPRGQSVGLRPSQTGRREQRGRESELHRLVPAGAYLPRRLRRARSADQPPQGTGSRRRDQVLAERRQADRPRPRRREARQGDRRGAVPLSAGPVLRRHGGREVVSAAAGARARPLGGRGAADRSRRSQRARPLRGRDPDRRWQRRRSRRAGETPARTLSPERAHRRRGRQRLRRPGHLRPLVPPGPRREAPVVPVRGDRYGRPREAAVRAEAREPGAPLERSRLGNRTSRPRRRCSRSSRPARRAGGGRASRRGWTCSRGRSSCRPASTEANPASTGRVSNATAEDVHSPAPIGARDPMLFAGLAHAFASSSPQGERIAPNDGSGGSTPQAARCSARSSLPSGPLRTDARSRST